MDPAIARVAAPTPVAFRDGLGERRRITDPTGKDLIDVLCLSSELTSVPSFEFTLRERVSRLASFRHPYFAYVRGVDRMSQGDSTLAVMSDATPGERLSEILAGAEDHHVPLDIGAALCLIRQLLPAIATLHEHERDAAHGALAPERLVITPRARLVVVDYAMGGALEQLRYSHQRYWKDLRIALPRSAGLPRFDHRVDVTQVGVVALSLILGRLLREDEYPSRVPELVASAWATNARGDLEPLPAGLRGWLTRALQIDLRNAFASVNEAGAEFDKVLAGDNGYLAEPAALEGFLARYHEVVAPPAEIEVTPVAVPAPPRLAATTPVPTPIEAPTPPSAPPIVAATPAAPTPLPVVTIPVGPPVPKKINVPTPPLPSPPPLPKPAAEVDALGPISTPSDPLSSHVDRPEFGPLPTIEDDDEFESATMDRTTVRTAPRTTGGPQLPPWTKIAAAAVAVLVVGLPTVFGVRHFTSSRGAATATGTVVFTTEPAGAETFVDGENRGATPLTLALKPGSHIVELKAAGASRKIPLNVVAGQQVSQYIELAKAVSTTGQLQVRSDPPGATVTVDGVSRGTSPVTVSDLTPGEHSVVVASSLGSATNVVNVEAGATASLMVPLAVHEGALSGWIAVSSPIVVQIYENGRLLGSSQSDRLMVSTGSHQVDLVNEAVGYRVSRTIQVSPGKVSPLAVKPPMGTIAINAIPWAEVWIDGEKIGETPIGNQQVAIGSHEIVFRHPEFGEQRQAVTVTLSTPARVSVDLRKK